MAERRLIEARREDDQPAGRPRRHLYRLTCDGQAAAATALAQAAPRPRPAGRRRLAAEGGA